MLIKKIYFYILTQFNGLVSHCSCGGALRYTSDEHTQDDPSIHFPISSIGSTLLASPSSSKLQSYGILVCIKKKTKRGVKRIIAGFYD
jgi:hypothetical protein